MSGLRRSQWTRVLAGGRCAAVAAGDAEKHDMRCCRELQPEPSPLRMTRSVGRAAGVGGRAARPRSAAPRVVISFRGLPCLTARMHYASIDAALRRKVKSRSRAPSLAGSQKLNRNFNDIRVRSFILTGAPSSSVLRKDL